MTLNRHQIAEIVLPCITLYWIWNNFAINTLVLLYATMVVFHTHMTIFMHRAWCHRAWIPSRWLTIYGLFVTTIIMGGSSIAWTAIHRKHHRYSDSEQDPHWPDQPGGVFSILFFQRLTPDLAYSKDLMQDPVHLWVHRHSWHLITAWYVLLFAIDPAWALFWAAASGFNRFVMNLINVVLHRNSQPINSPFWAVLFLQGEPWHRNHHDNQKDWRLGRTWYQIDIGKNLIQLFVLLGWARAR